MPFHAVTTFPDNGEDSSFNPTLDVSSSPTQQLLDNFESQPSSEIQDYCYGCAGIRDEREAWEGEEW